MFNANIFNEDIFNMGQGAPETYVEAVKTGTGGIDPSEAKSRIVKPTGLLHLPKRKSDRVVEQRIEESRELDVEIAAKLRQEFLEDSLELDAPLPAIAQMTAAQIEAEIKVLIHKKLRTESEEILLIMLMISVAI